LAFRIFMSTGFPDAGPAGEMVRRGMGPLAAAPRALAAALTRRAARVRDRIEHCFDRFDIVPDLAEDIGSARWFRGLGTMLGLVVAALSFWPNLTQVEAATGLPVDRATRDQFRNQMIMPLALGGESGSRMAPSARVVPLAFAPERPRIDLVATLGQGDSLGRMLQRAGVGAGDAARIGELVSRAVPLGEIGAGTRFDITLGRRTGENQPRRLENLAFRARFDLALAVTRSADGLALARRPIAVDNTPLRITGTVGSSLYRSARAAGVPAEAIRQYLMQLDSRVDLERDVSADDRFDIVVGYRRSAGGERQVGDLLYAGLLAGNKPRVQLVRWGRDGQFQDASGTARRVQGMVAPVAGRVTSGFGMRRHPILGYTRMHSGIDFGASWGAPIHAVSDGIVSFAGRHGGHGNYVRLDHGGGIGTGYAHMSRIAVAPGTRVQAGQIIGYVGSSGLSTGPHLHYELYRGGKTVNPGSISLTVTSGPNKEELARLRQRIAELRSITPGKALQAFRPGNPAAPAPRSEAENPGGGKPSPAAGAATEAAGATED